MPDNDSYDTGRKHSHAMHDALQANMACVDDSMVKLMQACKASQTFKTMTRRAGITVFKQATAQHCRWCHLLTVKCKQRLHIYDIVPCSMHLGKVDDCTEKVQHAPACIHTSKYCS